MEKLNLTKIYKSYYSAKTQPEIIDLPEVFYLSITGKGDPSDKLFAERTQALFTVAYSIKFYFKAINKDFVVAKLEGQWWFDELRFANIDIETAPKEVPRSEWEWRLLIRMPEFVNKEVVEKAKESAFAKKHNNNINDVEFFILNERKVVQMMHFGPFAEEVKTLKVMAEFIISRQLKKAGLHHEVYLSDLKKTSPAKLKTILREPIAF